MTAFVAQAARPSWCSTARRGESVLLAARHPTAAARVLLAASTCCRCRPGSRTRSTSWRPACSPWRSCRPAWCRRHRHRLRAPVRRAEAPRRDAARPAPAARREDRRGPRRRGRAGRGARRRPPWRSAGTRRGVGAGGARRRRSSAPPPSPASACSWPGRLRGEVTLAAANGLYLVLLLLGGMVFPLAELPRRARGGRRAAAGRRPGRGPAGARPPARGRRRRAWLVLAAWAVAAPAAAAATFRWE